MSTAPTLQDALAEIEKTQRNTQRLLDAGKLTPSVGAWKLACLARAHKAITFLAANEGWIADIYHSRERIRREAEILCAEDQLIRETLEAFEGAEVVDVRPLASAETTP